jgi:hypothetical protein
METAHRRNFMSTEAKAEGASWEIVFEEFNFFSIKGPFVYRLCRFVAIATFLVSVPTITPHVSINAHPLEFFDDVCESPFLTVVVTGAVACVIASLCFLMIASLVGKKSRSVRNFCGQMGLLLFMPMVGVTGILMVVVGLMLVILFSAPILHWQEFMGFFEPVRHPYP